MGNLPRVARFGAILAGWLCIGSQGGCFLVGYEGQLDRGPGEKGRTEDASADAASSSGWDAASQQPDTGAGALDAGSQHGDAGAPRDAGSSLDGSLQGHEAGPGIPDASGPEGGQEFDDAGPDGGHEGGVIVDPGHDSGTGTHPGDAGVPPTDGGSWWIDVPPTKPCTNGAYCPQACTAATSPCVFQCASISCLPSCQASTTCHTTCSSSSLGASCVNSCGANAHCVHDCSSIQCSSSCAAGSYCELDCHPGTSSCALTCTQGAHCLIKPNGSTTWSFDCKGAQQSCPGNVTTCDRDCP
jgi:hypothetical protein